MGAPTMLARLIYFEALITYDVALEKKKAQMNSLDVIWWGNASNEFMTLLSKPFRIQEALKVCAHIIWIFYRILTYR